MPFTTTGILKALTNSRNCATLLGPESTSMESHAAPVASISGCHFRMISLAIGLLL